MKISAIGVCVAVLLAATPATSSAQQVQLELRDGLVTLQTTNAMPSAILAEWARIGGVRVVDGERLAGAPLTLTLNGVPERQALDIVLRSAAGYIAAARPVGGAGASTFDRIVVMPVSANAAAARSGPAPLATPAAVTTMAPPMTEPVVTTPDEAQATDVADASMQDDGTAVEVPASSTDFDYANPQRYFAARAAQQRAAAAAAAAGGDGTDAGDAGGTASTAPGPGGFSTGTVLSSPGTIPLPEAPAPAGAAPSGRPPANPYGLPADAAPGSSSAPPMEPDRSKYINPYAPTPRPPVE